MEEPVAAGPVVADIRKEWHRVRPGLEMLLADNPDVQAIPEDIYAECRSGRSILWISDGYTIITEFEVDAHSGERDLCIAYAWTEERGGKLAPAAMDFMEHFARANNCAAITFGTRHQPLINYLCSEAGFRVSTQILRREIGV